MKESKQVARSPYYQLVIEYYISCSRFTSSRLHFSIPSYGNLLT